MGATASSLPTPIRIFCNICKTDTNHFCQAENTRDFLNPYDEGDGHFWIETLIFRFWVCAGCDCATLEQCYTAEGMTDPNGRQIYDCKYYPKRIKHDVAGKHFLKLPPKLDRIYRETIQAFNNGTDVLCAAGLRALIEGICVDKG